MRITAVLEPNSIHESIQGMKLNYVGMNASVFTGHQRPAREISAMRTGYVQGIELSILKALESRHNFTAIPINTNVSMHFKLKIFENESDWPEDSSIGLMLRKKVVLIIGDLMSVVHPRQHFVDLTLPPFSEGVTLMTKASLRSLSAKDVLLACGFLVLFLYVCSAVLVSIVMHATTLFKIKITTVFFYVSTLLFQQFNRPTLQLCRIGKAIDGIWRLSLFILGCLFSARLLQALARGHIDGPADANLAEIARFLRSNKDVHIYHNPRALFLDNIYTEDIDIIVGRCRTCEDCKETFLNQRVAFMLAELSRNRRVFWMHMRNYPVYIQRQQLFFFYLAFGVPKTRFFRHELDEVSLFMSSHSDRARTTAIFSSDS